MRLKGELAMSVDYKGLMYLLGLADKDEVCELAVLKKAMKERGVNQRGWRLFVDYGDLLIIPIVDHIASKSSNKARAMEGIRWLCVLQACEMDVPPPLKLSQSVAQWPLPGKTIADIPPLFLRTVWKAVLRKEYEKEDVQVFLEEDVLFFATWYLARGGKEKVSDAQLKAGWDTVWRVYEEDLRLPRNTDFSSWESWVNRVECDGYVFQALNSPAALYQEGTTMEHCIADYTHGCRVGKYRVYAVYGKKTDECVATLTVNFSAPDLWQLDEIHGPGNKEVSDRVLGASDSVCRSLNDFCRMSSQVRVAMNKQMKPLSA